MTVDWTNFNRLVQSCGGEARHFMQDQWELHNNFDVTSGRGECVPLVYKWLQCQVRGEDFVNVAYTPAGLSDIQRLAAEYYGNPRAWGWDNPHVDTVLRRSGLVLECVVGVSGIMELVSEHIVDDRYYIIMFGNHVLSRPFQGHIFGLETARNGVFFDPAVGLAKLGTVAWLCHFARLWLPEYRSSINQLDIGNIAIRTYRHDPVAANRPPTPIALTWQ
jgi:hypothetical protein